MKRVCTMFLTVIMVLFLASVAFATEQARPDGAIILGSIEDDEGYAEYSANYEVAPADAQPGDSDYEGLTKLFSLSANRVYDMLTTSASNGKYIMLNDLSGDVAIYGTLSYSPTPSATQRARGGLCVYDESKEEFVTYSYWYIPFTDGVYKFGTIDRTMLNWQDTYYGFVKNLIADDSHVVTGALTYADTN